MADTNNQRAQKFDNGWSAANAEAVILKGSTAKETALLESIRSLVVAAIQDIYGTSEDPKYIYIVDLILKRIKNTLADLNISSDLENIKSQLQTLTANFDSDQIKESVEKVFSSTEGEIKKQFIKYVEEQKAEFDELKTAITELTETVKSTPTEVETTSESALEDSAAVDKISQIADTVSQLETTIQIFAETIAVKFSEIQTTIDTRFSEITTTLTTIDKNLSDSMAATSKSFDDMSVKIEKSNKAILNAISQIQSGHSSGAVGAIGSSLINGIANITTGLFSSITSALTGITSGIASAVTSSIKSNEILAKLDKVDATTVKNVEIVSKTLALTELNTATATASKPVKKKGSGFSKLLTNPKLFAKLIAKHLTDYQKKIKSPTEQRVEDLEWSISGLFKNLRHNISRTFIGLNRFLKKGFKGITKSIKGLGSKLKGMMSSTVSGLASVFSLVMSPVGFMVSSLFKMVSFIFKPLQWFLNFLKSPAFLIAIGAALLIFWPKIKGPIMEWYKTNIEPAFGKIKEVFMSDMPFFDKITETMKILWDAIWKPFGGFKGAIKKLTKKLANFAKETLWPFVKDKVWPFMKQHWKEILVGIAGIGILSFLKNPMSVVSLALKAPTAILNTIKVVQLLVKGIIIAMQVAQAALPALIAAAPIAIPALVVTAILGGAIFAFWKAWKDEEEARAARADAKAIALMDEQQEIHDEVEKINKATNDVFKQYGEVLKAQGILKPEEQMLDLYELPDGTKVSKEKLDEYIEKQSKNTYITSGGGLERTIDAIKEGKLELNASMKEGLLARYVSRISGMLTQTRNFVNSYISEKSNFVGDPTIMKRFDHAVKVLKTEENRIHNELKWFNKEYFDDRYATGSDEDWNKWLAEHQQRTANEMRKVISILVTREDGTTTLGLNAKDVVDQSMKNMFDTVNNAVAGQNLDTVKRMLESNASSYDAVIGKQYLNAANKAANQFTAFMKESNLLQDQTEVAESYRERMKELAQVAAKSKMTQNGGKPLTEAESRAIFEDATMKMYGEVLEKLQSNPNDASAKLALEQLNNTEFIKKRVANNVQAVEKLLNQSNLSASQETIDKLTKQLLSSEFTNGRGDIDFTKEGATEELLDAYKKTLKRSERANVKDEQILAKLNEIVNNQHKQSDQISSLETGTTNNYTAVGISGGQITGQQNKENARR